MVSFVPDNSLRMTTIMVEPLRARDACLPFIHPSINRHRPFLFYQLQKFRRQHTWAKLPLCVGVPYVTRLIHLTPLLLSCTCVFRFPVRLLSSARMDGQLHVDRPQIAILDFGSQYSHLIARRVRELHVFCELYSCLVKGEVLRKNQVIGIILSGGPNSVYAVSSGCAGMRIAGGDGDPGAGASEGGRREFHGTGARPDAR